MEAPEPIKSEIITPNKKNVNIDFIEELIVKNEKRKYRIHFWIIQNQNELVIRVSPEKSKDLFYFQHFYTIFEIQKLSKAFALYETLKDIIIFLKKLNFEIEEKIENVIIKFNIYMPDGQNKLIQLNLGKNIHDKNHIIKYFLEEIQEFKNNMKITQENLKQEINMLKEKNLKYEKNINNLNENIKNNIEQISILKCNKKLFLLMVVLMLLFIFSIHFIHNYKVSLLKSSLDNINNIIININKEIFNIKEVNKSLYEEELKSFRISIENDVLKNKNEISNIKKEGANKKEYEKFCEEKINSLKKLLNNDIIKNKNDISNLIKENQNLTEKNKELTKSNKILYQKIDELNKLSETLMKQMNIFPHFESKIIFPKNKIDFILDYIREKDKSFNFNEIKLLYRGSRDGDKTKTCHKLCDNKKNVLIFIKSETDFIFGGYSKIGFQTRINSNELPYQKDNNSFLFSINLKRIYPVIKGKNIISVYDNEDKGLCFTGNFCFYDNFMNKFSYIGDYIIDYFNGFEKLYEMNGGKDIFQIKELEVFQLL